MRADVAHSILTALRRCGSSTLLDVLSRIGGDEDVLEGLLTRLSRAASRDLELGHTYELLLSWLVMHVGPKVATSCEALEQDFARYGVTSLVIPRWTLAVPVVGALQRRLPCTPLIADTEPELAAAYRGLTDHLNLLAVLPSNHRQLELINTAIPWRVVALADRLEPPTEKTSNGDRPVIATRLQMLGGRTIDSARGIEHEWWNLLIKGSACSRRHALSHLGETKDGWTFTRCVDQMWTLNEARGATAAIALVFIDRIAKYIRNHPVNSTLLDNALRDRATAWLDLQS